MSLLLRHISEVWCPDNLDVRGRAHSSTSKHQSVTDALPGVLQAGVISGESDSASARSYRTHCRLSTENATEAFPRILRTWGWDHSNVPQWKPKTLNLSAPDVLLSLSPVAAYPWIDDPRVDSRRLFQRIISLDSWWPRLIEQPNPLLPGGYKPSSVYEGRNEDYDFINRVEATIEAIDDQLVALSRESKGENEGGSESSGYTPSNEPIVLPPSWKTGRDKARNQTSEVKPSRYEFTSDFDWGARQKISMILELAKKRRINVLESKAFRTSETAQVHGHLVVEKTNAWILKVNPKDRLELAKEATVEGFKLLSFDDTTLSFIFRPSHQPWKQVYMGAGLGSGIGAAILTAGLGLGYLIWGRKANSPILTPTAQEIFEQEISLEPTSQKTQKTKEIKRARKKKSNK